MESRGERFAESTRPLRVTHHTTVLVLQVLCVCLDVENVPFRDIGLGRACLVRAGDRLQVRHGGIQLRVFVQNGGGLLGGSTRGGEGGFQDQGLCGGGGRKLGVVATVVTGGHQTGFCVFEIEVVGADGAEAKRHRAGSTVAGGCGVSFFGAPVELCGVSF